MSKRLCDIGGLMITSFHGGRERGRCLQFDIAPAFVVLEKQDVEKIRLTLEKWLSGWESKKR